MKGSKKKLKPKVSKGTSKEKIEVAQHLRVTKDTIENVDQHQRLEDVSNVHDKGEKRTTTTDKASPDEKRMSMVENIDKKFKEADGKEWGFEDYSEGFPISGEYTDMEYNVMRDYVNEIGFNEKLRDNLAQHVDDPDIKLLDSAISKADGLAKDTVGVRGTKRDFHETIGRELKVGEVFQDNAYMSTTVKPDISTNFMYRQSEADGLLRFGTMFKVDLPKGTKALPVNISEFELLLPRGMQFEVLQNEIIDMQKDSGKLPKAMQDYAAMAAMMTDGQHDPDMFKMRSIHLRAMPNESQMATSKRSEKVKPKTARKTIRRPKKK